MRKLQAAVIVCLLPVAATAAENWADNPNYADHAEFKPSRLVCDQFRHTLVPDPARPDRRAELGLADCDSAVLFYGIGEPADPQASHACALAEEGGSGHFNGNSLLMTIYATGKGAPRNLDAAIAIACTIGGAPYEIHSRVTALYEARQGRTDPKDFSWCDHITSGYGMGWCASLDQRIAEAERARKLGAIADHWRAGPAAKDLDRLLQAAEDFARVRGDTEVDQMGTARAAMSIWEEEALRKEFLADLEAFAAGNPPCSGLEADKDADARLNAAYRQIMALPAERFHERNGTVTPDQVRTTQRAWLKYRDAWVAFVKAAYPTIPREAVVNWLTRGRTAQLAEFLQ